MSKAKDNLDLMFGLTALHLDFIDEDQLLADFKSYLDSKAASLDGFFVGKRTLSENELAEIRVELKKRLKGHHDNPKQALTSIQSVLFPNSTGSQTIREFLTQYFGDENQTIHSSIQEDPYKTQAHTTTTPTADARFQVLRPHAKGGLGQVSVAQDREINREVALKELQLRFASNENIKGRFLMEAEITGALEHPGIVPVYGRGQYPDGRPYYAMRFVRGDTLHDAIDQVHKKQNPVDYNKVEFRKLIQRFIDVCDTIQYAHSRGIVHRDIKPANIIHGNFGETIVVDWGLAKRIGEQDELTLEPPIEFESAESGIAPTMLGSVVGTPGYMSPEQANGRHDLVGKQSDIYSLGATLYHILAGQSSVSAKDGDLLGDGDFPALSEINRNTPAALEAICSKAMKKSLSERYESVLNLSEDLQHWLAGQSVSAKRDSAWERFSRWCRNHQTLVASLVAATAVALIAMTASRILLQSAYDREQAGFQQTRKTVDEYFTLVSEEALLDQPGLQPLRRKLLNQARVYYEGFVEERTDDPAVIAELGRARFRLGQITEIVDSPEAAISQYQAAIAIQKEQQFDSTYDPNFLNDQQQLASSFNALGGALQKTSRFDEAVEAFQQASTKRESLCELEPGNTEFQRQLANTLMNMGTTHRAMKKATKAKDFFLKSQRVRENALKLAPQESQYNLRRDLGKGSYNFANFLLTQNEKAQGEQNFERAVVEFEILLKERSNDQSIQNLLAISLRRLGDMHFEKQPSKALDSYTKALDVMEPLAKFNSDVLDYQLAMAGILKNMAEVNLQLENKSEAANLFARTAQIYKNHLEVLKPGSSELRDYVLSELSNAQIRLTVLPHETTNQLADLERRLSEVCRALEHHPERFNANTTISISNCYLELGRSQFAQGKWKQSSHHMQQNIDLLGKIADTDSLSDLSKLERVNTLAEIGVCLAFLKSKPELGSEEFENGFDKDTLQEIEEQAEEFDESELKFDRLFRLVMLANLMRSTSTLENSIHACESADLIAKELKVNYRRDPSFVEIQVELHLAWANSLLHQLNSETQSDVERSETLKQARENLAAATTLSPNHPSIAPTIEMLQASEPK